MLLRKTAWFWKSGLAVISFVLMLSVSGCSDAPSEEDTVQVKGYVELSFLHSLGLQNISIRLLPAAVIFEYYLSECKMPIEKLQLDLGAVDYGRIDQGTTA